MKNKFGMKKMILTAIITTIASSLFAQTNNDTVYVVFTSISEKGTGVNFVSVYDPEVDRTPVRGYFIVDLDKDYLCRFMYFNQKDEPNNPIATKPLSFLDTIEYIDWDEIHPGLTAAQAEAKFEEIQSHKKIYFIDRNEIANNTIQLVPVTTLKSTF